MYNLWNKCLIKLKNNLSKYEFNMWILPLQVLIIKKYIYLCAPNIYIFNNIYKRYLNLIYKYIIKYNINFYIIKFIIGDKKLITKRFNLKKKKYIILNNYFDIKDFYLFKKYNFENFIYGKSNFLVYSKLYNLIHFKKIKFKLIFLYSNSGLGKTHLLCSVKNYIDKIYKIKKDVIYINSLNFIKKMYLLINKYNFNVIKYYINSINFFLIDNINFIKNNIFLQKKFYFVLKYLIHYKFKLYIIISSNIIISKLNFIKKLSSLLSNFVININNIDFVIKRKFIKKFFIKNNMLLNDNIINYICSIKIDNFFQLKEILNIIFFYSSYYNCLKNIEICFIKKIFNNFLNTYNNYLFFCIQKSICIYYNINIKKLLSKSRIKNILYPRQIFIFLSKKIINYSLYKLSYLFNNLSYYQILYSYNKIKKLYYNNNLIKKDINSLIKIILKNKNAFYIKERKNSKFIK